ncbi:MAG: DPP IV N-terminal domain-containing protein, partial [Roseimicrobium sp.]
MIRHFNLWCDGQPLTTDGTLAHAYREVFHSPDNTKALALQIEPEQEHLVYHIESSPKDQVQPKLHSQQYLKPGDKIAHPHPRLIDIATRKVLPLDETLLPVPWSLGQVHWAPDGKTVFMLYNKRGHQTLRLLAVDARTGQCHCVIEEKSATFIDYSQKTYLHFLDATNEVLWASERDGWNHLYLYDTKTHQVKQQVTQGQWLVRQVLHVDEAKREVWFMANGLAQLDPYYQQLCRVRLDGTGSTLLTDAPGTHEVTFSPDRQTFLDQW